MKRLIQEIPGRMAPDHGRAVRRGIRKIQVKRLYHQAKSKLSAILQSGQFGGIIVYPMRKRRWKRILIPESIAAAIVKPVNGSESF
jgi:hypothetical protein